MRKLVNIAVILEADGKPTTKVFAHYRKEGSDVLYKATLLDVDLEARAAIASLGANILTAVEHAESKAATP